MARKRKKSSQASLKLRGLKVFGALLVGIALAVLITQYNAVQERTKRFADRVKPGGAPEEPLRPADEPISTEPEAKSADVADVQSDAGEGQWLPSDGDHDCPEEFPIKGNANSRIYHLPSGASYNATIPNICFATEEAADAAGFHAAKR
jgi:large subunit ribosomal protein L17